MRFTTMSDITVKVIGLDLARDGFKKHVVTVGEIVGHKLASRVWRNADAVVGVCSDTPSDLHSADRVGTV
jgi:hypothetical protein